MTTVCQQNKTKVTTLEKGHKVTVRKIERVHSNVKIEDDKISSQLKKNHLAELRKVQSNECKSSQEASKTIVNL